MSSNKVVYRNDYGLFDIEFKYFKRFLKMGFNNPSDIPRHHPLLIQLFEQVGEELGKGLEIKELKGSIYTISTDFGKETVLEPEDIKWKFISS